MSTQGIKTGGRLSVRCCRISAVTRYSIQQKGSLEPSRLYPFGGTLKAEQQVCKLDLTLEPKEVRNAHGPCCSDTVDCKVRALVFQAAVGTRAGVGSGGVACPGQPHGDGSAAGDGTEPGGAVSEVSSGPESGAVVERGRRPGAAGTRGASLRPRRASRAGDRRHPGTTAGREDPSQRDLARSGALRALPYGESQRAALARCNGIGGDSLGRARLGVTISHGVMSLGALSPAAGAAPQAVTRVGGASAGVVPPLAARTGGGRGG